MAVESALRNLLASYSGNIGEECWRGRWGEGEEREVLRLRNGESNRFPPASDHFRERVN